MVILDVRTEEEFAGVSVPKSVNFPLQDLVAGKMPDIDKDEEIHLYCRSGGRAEAAKNILEKNGFSNVANKGTVFIR